MSAVWPVLAGDFPVFEEHVTSEQAVEELTIDLLALCPGVETLEAAVLPGGPR
jgi:hypothetical protein